VGGVLDSDAAPPYRYVVTLEVEDMEEIGRRRKVGSRWRARRSHNYRRSRFTVRYREDADGLVERSADYQRLMRKLLRLRNEGEISSEVMRRIERDLDLEESRIGG
jgi:hypothetical protein